MRKGKAYGLEGFVDVVQRPMKSGPTSPWFLAGILFATILFGPRPAFADAIPDSDLEQILDFLLAGELTAAPDGEQLAKDQGCLGCHSTDGSELVGPSFQAILGRKTKIDGAGEITVDAVYLRRSITHPGAQIVEGFPPIMPAYDQLSDAELQALVDYLQGVK